MQIENPEQTGTALVSPGQNLRPPGENPDFRYGQLLEAAAQEIYNRTLPDPLGDLNSPFLRLACSCTEDERARSCVRCRIRLLQGFKETMGDGGGLLPSSLELRPRHAEEWPTIAGVLEARISSSERYFGTPDRLDLLDRCVIGTEFKAGSAELKGDQRDLAKVGTELGVPIIVARLNAEESNDLEPNQVCSVPYRGNDNYAIARTQLTEPAADVTVQGRRLVEYWAEKGIGIPGDAPVYGMEFSSRWERSYYPEQLIQPLDLSIARLESLEPSEPFPWTEYEAITESIEPVDGRSMTERDLVEKRMEQSDRLAFGSIPLITPRQVREYIPQCSELSLAEIEELQETWPRMEAWPQETPREQTLGEIETSFSQRRAEIEETYDEKLETYRAERQRQWESTYPDGMGWTEQDWNEFHDETAEEERQIMRERRSQLDRLEEEKARRLSSLRERDWFIVPSWQNSTTG